MGRLRRAAPLIGGLMCLKRRIFVAHCMPCSAAKTHKLNKSTMQLLSQADCLRKFSKLYRFQTTFSIFVSPRWQFTVDTLLQKTIRGQKAALPSLCAIFFLNSGGKFRWCGKVREKLQSTWRKHDRNYKFFRGHFPSCHPDTYEFNLIC